VSFSTFRSVAFDACLLEEARSFWLFELSGEAKVARNTPKHGHGLIHMITSTALRASLVGFLCICCLAEEQPELCLPEQLDQ
jgi:hypothetical protein